MNLNTECCGSHCRETTGEVRKYPLGGGANLILCRACWAHENSYRFGRARERNVDPANFPQVDWATAEIVTHWSGAPDPDDPDNFWIDDKTGERVNAHTGKREQRQ